MPKEMLKAIFGQKKPHKAKIASEIKNNLLNLVLNGILEKLKNNLRK